MTDYSLSIYEIRECVKDENEKTPAGHGGRFQWPQSLVFSHSRCFRYNSPYLNQFIQPDTIVPDPRIPADWNRYTYARNNPIKYIDPTGKSSCYEPLPSACLVALQLLHNYATAIKQGVEYGDLPVEGFAKFVDFGRFVFNGDIRDMMWAITIVLDDFDANRGFVWSQVRNPANSPYYIHQDWLPYRHTSQYDDPDWGGGEYGIWIHSLRGDWKSDYWDKTANQAYHFWFYVAVAFFDGSGWATSGNLVHDAPPWDEYDYILSSEDEAPPPRGRSKPDYYLGLQGIYLGEKLRMESIIQDVIGDCDNSEIYNSAYFTMPGDWMRSRLK